MFDRKKLLCFHVMLFPVMEEVYYLFRHMHSGNNSYPPPPI